MGRLTTHVLDTAHGIPAKSLRIGIFAWRENAWQALGEFLTNNDGRTDAPLLQDNTFQAGRYRLEFGVGAYFAGLGLNLPDPPFLDVVPIEFGLTDAHAHHHVPLLVSPFAYSTYRGS